MNGDLFHHSTKKQSLPSRAIIALMLYILPVGVLYFITHSSFALTYLLSIPFLLAIVGIWSRHAFGRFFAAWLPVFILLISSCCYLYSVAVSIFDNGSAYNSDIFGTDFEVGVLKAFALYLFYYAIPILPATLLLNHPQVVSAYRNFSNNAMSESDKPLLEEE